jgi:HPt (histidine-containing phosphotransfer) domain-containing protein
MYARTDEMTQPPIDGATFEELEQTAGAGFVRELVDTFLAEAPLMLAALDRALAARDAGEFRRAAHSLKSNSNTFGAFALGALARDLELAGIDPALADNAKSLEALRLEYARVAKALTELRRA